MAPTPNNVPTSSVRLVAPHSLPRQSSMLAVPELRDDESESLYVNTVTTKRAPGNHQIDPVLLSDARAVQSKKSNPNDPGSNTEASRSGSESENDHSRNSNEDEENGNSGEDEDDGWGATNRRQNNHPGMYFGPPER